MSVLSLSLWLLLPWLTGENHQEFVIIMYQIWLSKSFACSPSVFSLAVCTNSHCTSLLPTPWENSWRRWTHISQNICLKPQANFIFHMSFERLKTEFEMSTMAALFFFFGHSCRTSGRNSCFILNLPSASLKNHTEKHRKFFRVTKFVYGETKRPKNLLTPFTCKSCQEQLKSAKSCRKPGGKHQGRMESKEESVLVHLRNLQKITPSEGKCSTLC